MIFKYILSTIKLIFIIMTFTYFLGISWQVITMELYMHFKEENELLDPELFNTETFITTNDMDPSTSSRTDSHNIVLLMYFSYTTLSTVGFGDFNPRSDQERLLCILILMLGVGIFALILGNFNEILERFQTLDEQAGDEDELNKFFDTLKIRYNHGYDIDPQMKQKIEQYFEYKWVHDRNQAIDEPEELAFLE